MHRQTSANQLIVYIMNYIRLFFVALFAISFISCEHADDEQISGNPYPVEDYYQGELVKSDDAAEYRDTCVQIWRDKTTDKYGLVIHINGLMGYESLFLEGIDYRTESDVLYLEANNVEGRAGVVETVIVTSLHGTLDQHRLLMTITFEDATWEFDGVGVSHKE